MPSPKWEIQMQQASCQSDAAAHRVAAEPVGDGPLADVPFVLKDPGTAYKGMPSTFSLDYCVRAGGRWRRGSGGKERDHSKRLRPVRGAAGNRPVALVIVPPRSSAAPSETAGTEPTRRDLHLQFIAERGRMAWQKASGYNRRALVEANISRYKRVIGDALRSHTDGRQATEVAIAAGVLNRMLELGRPESVRIM
jgi:hypothetical protein